MRRLLWRLGHQPVLPRSLSWLLPSSQFSYLQRSLSSGQQVDSRVFTFGPELMSKRLLCQWGTVVLSTQVCCPAFMKVCGSLRFGGVLVGSATLIWCHVKWAAFSLLTLLDQCGMAFHPGAGPGLLESLLGPTDPYLVFGLTFMSKTFNGHHQIEWLRETS